MKKLISVLAVTAAVSLSGCSSVNDMLSYKDGTKITTEQMNTLKIGKTKRSDVVNMLGAPSDISMVGNQQHYIYNYTAINTFQANEFQSVRLIFDKNDRLVEIQKGKSPSSSNALLKG